MGTLQVCLFSGVKGTAGKFEMRNSKFEINERRIADSKRSEVPVNHGPSSRTMRFKRRCAEVARRKPRMNTNSHEWGSQPATSRAPFAKRFASASDSHTNESTDGCAAKISRDFHCWFWRRDRDVLRGKAAKPCSINILSVDSAGVRPFQD